MESSVLQTGETKAEQTRNLDVVWRALANLDRRRMLDLLRAAEKSADGGGLTTGELVMAFGELSRFAVMQHLRVLQKANLVVAHKQGRTVLNHLNAVPLREIYERWVSEFEGSWASSLIQLRDAAEGKPRDARGVKGDSRKKKVSNRDG